ncbi:nucleotide sugar dehydrogenase [Enterococcus ureasiticus]|uniref:UDP-N-acetyl-D-galactosamine dehydrogenase n=1 Tax=Enterococcus ureasiticus TaxID=903984 RepID=A0A1E5GGW0_9ENTE|nr:nucleotide sugar dehydrogenase [Enterococcus ureasiticus]OEG11964.1 UDP-N-acetyl-D-galactosamine dehydrogenase [Enterococcus ureasiticus]
MSPYQELIEKKTALSVIGLGYVGMPLAVAFSKKLPVIGFDTNQEKVAQYLCGIDPTKEVGAEEIATAEIHFTNNEADLKKASFHIVAVPTPVTVDKNPDLEPIKSACMLLGRNLKKGDILVFESTVYPGATEDICIPILEAQSHLISGKDFFVGYSPERINPGDKVHTLESIVKIVSGCDNETLETIAQVYELVIDAGVHRAPSIKVAEAAKVVENSQRDINIAFMNELAMVFDKMSIDTSDVLAAMATKWNALTFYPGLVGGHCIGVDPYYFISEAEKLGYHSQIIAAGRKVNDGMGEFIAEVAIKELIQKDCSVKKARIGILGLTFKENCPDIRNTKVVDIITHLHSYGVEQILVSDCWADQAEVSKEYGIELTPETELKNLDCLIVAVGHDAYCQFKSTDLQQFFAASSDILVDVKGLYKENQKDFHYWNL